MVPSLAEGTVEHGKDYVNVDGAVAGTASQDRRRRIGLEWRQCIALPLWLGRNDDGLAMRQHGRARSRLGITGAQVRRASRFSLQQLFGVAGGDPAAFLGDADRDHLILALVDSLKN